VGTPKKKHDDGVDRRTLIKRALAASGAVYVAPMILGTASPASAQVISGSCPGPECDDTGCGPDGECACVSILGGSACVVPSCTFVACDSHADCGPDGVCMTSDCCDEGEPTCVFLCGAVIPPGPVGLLSAPARSAWRQVD